MNQSKQKQGKILLRAKYMKQGGSARFISFIKYILSSNDEEIIPQLKVACLLIVNDVIPLKELERALCSMPFKWQGSVYLSWDAPDGRHDRRMLGKLTLCVLQRATWTDVQAITINDIANVYMQFAGKRNVVDEMWADCLSWFSESLSGPAFHHVAGLERMTALPDTALAREESRQALVKEVGDVSGVAMGHALAGIFDPVGIDKNAIYIKKIVNACSEKTKKEMIAECLLLAPHAAAYGLYSSLILAWVLDLIESGTPTKEDVSVKTIQTYVGAVAEKIYIFFKHESIAEIDAEKFSVIYLAIRESCPPKRQGIAASALVSFHHFLVQWLDVSPLTISLRGNLAVALPDANMVWPHEIALIFSCLEQATCDERLVHQWRVAFAIASTCRIRTSELLALTVNSFIKHSSVLEVQIAGTKSFSGKRTITIHDANAIDIIYNFVERRQLENAMGGDLLFGDPFNARKHYQLGMFLYGLSRLLKDATGDVGVVFHTLSHSIISTQAEQDFISGIANIKEMNPIYQTSTNSAHHSPTTTICTYAHLFERFLRIQLDKALVRIGITSKIAATWSDKIEVAIRQAAHRCRKNTPEISLNQVHWQFILQSNPSVQFQSVSNNVLTEIPDIPLFLLNSNALSIQHIFNTLHDVANGLPLAAVASRANNSENWVIQMIMALKAICYQNRWWAKTISFRSTEAEVICFLSRCGDEFVGADFRRNLPGKIDMIKSRLSSISLKSNKQLLINAFDSWVNNFKSGYVEIKEQSHSLEFIRFLFDSGMDINHIAIFVASAEPENPSYEEKIHAKKSLQIFATIFKLTPAHFFVKKRDGRPGVYLILTSSRVLSGQMPASAAISMASFNALMLSLGVFIYMGTKNE